eukprot:XP_011604815.1 PREDICTED: neurogenic locus protein delta-like [Takifugu rubripes]
MFFFPTAASPCLSSPCSNGGTCEEIDNGYRCQCPKGFEGIHCDDESQDTVGGLETKWIILIVVLVVVLVLVIVITVVCVCKRKAKKKQIRENTHSMKSTDVPYSNIGARKKDNVTSM